MSLLRKAILNRSVVPVLTSLKNQNIFAAASLQSSYFKRLSSSARSQSEEHSPETVSEEPTISVNPKCDNCPEIQQRLKNALKEQKEYGEKIEDLTDKYKRALAEMENVRRRLMKQADDARIFAVQGFAKDLLDVADSLYQANKSVSAATVHDDGSFLALRDGLVLTDNQLHQVFAKHGLRKVDPKVGDKFNPDYHEALFQVPSMGGEAGGTIAAVEKVGYALHKRCVRAAIVGVFM